MIRNARLATWCLVSLLIRAAGNVQLNYCQLKWQREVPAFTECPFGEAHFSVTWPVRGKARMMWNATHPEGTWMPPYFAVIDEADKDMRWYLKNAFIFYGYVPYGIMVFAFASCVPSIFRRRIGTRDLSFFMFAGGVFVLNEIILKNVFREARPMQSCCTTCGMPSGHSALAVGYWTCMVLDVSLRVYSDGSEHHGGEYEIRGWKSFRKALQFILCPGCSFSPDVTHFDFVFIAITWSVLLLPVPFSRIGTHDHTPAQVMVGCSVGFICGILWMAFIRRMQHCLFDKSGAVIFRFPPYLHWCSKEINYTVNPTKDYGFTWEMYRAVIARVDTDSEAYDKGVLVGSKLTKVGDYDGEKDPDERKKEVKLERRLLEHFLLKHKEGKKFDVTFVQACRFCRWPLIEVMHDFLLPKQIAEESQARKISEDHLSNIWRYYKSFSSKGCYCCGCHCCPDPSDIRVEPVVDNETCRGCIELELELPRVQLELSNFSGEVKEKVARIAQGIETGEDAKKFSKVVQAFGDISCTVLPRLQFELSNKTSEDLEKDRKVVQDILDMACSVLPRVQFELYDRTGANTWIRYEVFSESNETWEAKEDLRLDIRDEKSRTLRSKPMVFARKFRFQVYQSTGNERVWPHVDLAEKTKTAIRVYFQQGCKGNVNLGKDGDVLRFTVTHPTLSADDVKLVPHEQVDQKAESDKPLEAGNSSEKFESLEAVPPEQSWKRPLLQDEADEKQDTVLQIGCVEGAGFELPEMGGTRRDIESTSRGGGRIQIRPDGWEMQGDDGTWNTWKPFRVGKTLDVRIGERIEVSDVGSVKHWVTFDTEHSGKQENMKSGQTRVLRKVVGTDYI